ncbi:sugar-binding domain-containing protein [Kribbella sp. NPDC056861]|uniref:glycoside hydrolase family 2 protein n=1 Tax=Kribbella sp. NPDC056861 TaxID=3154857 RepID=UPI00341AAD80
MGVSRAGWFGRLSLVFVLLVAGLVAIPASAVPAKVPPLTTPWTASALNGTPLPEYPRPQMTRPDWANLNGEWQLQQSTADTAPVFGATLPERVNVPFAVETALSGVMRAANDNRHYLTYRRTFTIPAGWSGRRVNLNFGAVDWRTTVWVNGQQVGQHTGAYDSFVYDITPQLTGGTNELIVRVFDPTDTGTDRPLLGKQTANPGGLLYTPTSGIWQTVWLEPTPVSSIFSADTYPNLANNTLRTKVFTSGNVAGFTVLAEALSGSTVVGITTGTPGADFAVPVPNPRLWTPEDPYLYNLRLTLRNAAGQVVDTTMHYFGMREIGMKLIDGRMMPTLNGQFVFQAGTLDQGYWPDGGMTAPTDAALAFDLEKHKELGFNMVRKHIKVESQRWYYHADRLGLLVWQDMPSQRIGASRTAAQLAQQEQEMRNIVDQHRSSPAVVMYVIFNEGWGEPSPADVVRISGAIKSYDPTRLVNASSGYNITVNNDTGAGQVDDQHNYAGPDSGHASTTRIAVNGEYGSLALRTPGHEYSPNGNYGYAELFTSGGAMTDRYVAMMTKMQGLIRTKGTSAGVFTEISDVEGEPVGFYTYDRQVTKYDWGRVRAANLALIAMSRTMNNGGGGSPATVHNELPAGFTQCATEGQTCSFTGARQVAYGAGGYSYKTATATTACTPSAFGGGDPAPGVLKSCYVAPLGGPSGWTQCAVENGSCNPGGPARIAYGNNGKFNYVTAQGPTACTNGVFGDAFAGVAKACYVAPSGGPSAAWVQCGSEGATCAVDSGTVVAYGAKGAFSYNSALAGNASCGSATFGGDPIANVAKACYVRNGGPAGFGTTCAGENGTCTFAGFRTVAYGGRGSFVYKSFTGSAPCNSSFSGFDVDPAFKVVKSCYLTP